MASPLAQQQARDHEARDHEEDVDPDEPAREQLGGPPEVVEDHEADGDRTQALDVRPEGTV